MVQFIESFRGQGMPGRTAQGIEAGMAMTANRKKQEDLDSLRQRMAIEQGIGQPVSAPVLGAAGTYAGGSAGLGAAPQQAPQQNQVLPSEEMRIRFPDQYKAMLDSQKSQYEMMDGREKQRLDSVIKGAAEIKDLPPEAQLEYLTRREQDLVSRNVDATDTREIKKLLQSGQVEEAQARINSAVEAGQALRILQPSVEDKSADRALRDRQIAVSERAENRMSNKLSAGLEKALLDAQDGVATAQRNANEYDVLAGDFERNRTELEGGYKGSLSEFLKGVLGTQDDVTEFRRRFNKVRLSEGLKNLPPGPATDRDVQEAFKGVPKDNASPEQVASFLRGAARLARFEAGYNQFKADYISGNASARNMNKVWRATAKSPNLSAKVTVGEIYETAQNKGITPDEVAKRLGLDLSEIIKGSN